HDACRCNGDRACRCRNASCCWDAFCRDAEDRRRADRACCCAHDRAGRRYPT
ncbi:hypothetical protein GTP56_00005, partial [Duganella sp. FT134W]|nr:hypothetical protein [Duganella margarita]